MEYEEKIELKNEITNSTKRKMKTCIALAIATLLAEAAFWYLYILSHKLELDGSEVFLFGMFMFCSRMLQFSFISGFTSE